MKIEVRADVESQVIEGNGIPFGKRRVFVVRHETLVDGAPAGASRDWGVVCYSRSAAQAVARERVHVLAALARRAWDDLTTSAANCR